MVLVVQVDAIIALLREHVVVLSPLLSKFLRKPKDTFLKEPTLDALELIARPLVLPLDVRDAPTVSSAPPHLRAPIQM